MIYAVGDLPPKLASSAEPETKQTYVFPASIMGTKVRATTGLAFNVQPSPDETDASALLDTGADTCITPHTVCTELGLPIIPDVRKRVVVLGDDKTVMPVLGTTKYNIRLGKVSSEVEALVIPVTWGAKQHVVLGADWIKKNRVMLGVRNEHGPTVEFTDPSGVIHSHYAKPRNTRTAKHIPRHCRTWLRAATTLPAEALEQYEVRQEVTTVTAGKFALALTKNKKGLDSCRHMRRPSAHR